MLNYEQRIRVHDWPPFFWELQKFEDCHGNSTKRHPLELNAPDTDFLLENCISSCIYNISRWRGLDRKTSPKRADRARRRCPTWLQPIPRCHECVQACGQASQPAQGPNLVCVLKCWSMHDKEIAQPSRPQHRATPFSKAAVSYERGHG